MKEAVTTADGRPSGENLAALHAASFAWAMVCCSRKRPDAEEVLQISYDKVLTGRARFDERSELRTWFFGVIRVTAHEYFRHAWLRSLRNVLLGEEHEDDSLNMDGIAMGEDARQVRQALSTLPPRQREALHLTFYQGMTLAEAAEVMNVSIGSVRQHYERGKTALRERLESKGWTS